MTILQLHKPKAANDVVAGLRALADRIEAGEPDWPVTTAIVLLGHTDSEIPDGDSRDLQQSRWATYGYGPRTDVFTMRGLLASVMRNWEC